MTFILTATNLISSINVPVNFRHSQKVKIICIMNHLHFKDSSGMYMGDCPTAMAVKLFLNIFKNKSRNKLLKLINRYLRLRDNVLVHIVGNLKEILRMQLRIFALGT